MLRQQILRASRASTQSLKAQLSRQQSIASSFSSQSYRAAAASSQNQSPIQQYLGRRWQSTEAEKKDDTASSSETKPAESSSSSSSSPEDALKQELEKKNKEVIDLKDKYLRSVADYRNLQDRTTREQSNARQFAIQKFASDILDSVDNLDRALSSVPRTSLGESDPSNPSAAPVSEVNADLKALYGGLTMTNDILMQALKKHGLERFDPTEGEGRKFDPNLDEATFFTKVEGKQDGDVFYTQSKGFTLNGRVIRAAKVGVVKNS